MVKKGVLSVFVMMALTCVSLAATLNADPKNSGIFFSIDNGMGYAVGYFEKFSASVETEGDKIISAKAAIDTNSINTHSSWHDAGLRSPLFFDAAKFPQATFESSKVDGDQMTGTLTIKGISKPVTLTIGYAQGVFTAKGSFNRNDFGVSFNPDLPHHEKALGDNVDLMVELRG